MDLNAQELVSDVRSAFDRGTTLPLAWRRQQLRALLLMLEEQEQAFIDALGQDLRKSEFESYATEIGDVKAQAKQTLSNLRKWTKARPFNPGLMLMPATGAIVREPYGVALIIAPWNYPVQLALAPLIGAIAAGNAVIVKPSEMTPTVSRALATHIPNYLDNEAIRVVEGGVDETTALLEQRYDLIFYTGNGRVGRIVARAAAEHLTPTVLELGGKSPVFIDGTVDLATAADRIAWGKFTNAGQTCVAPDYILATDDIAPEFERHLVESVRRMFGDDPHESPDYGRIVNDAHVERLSGLLSSGRTVLGGTVDAADRYIAPTIVADIHGDDAVMQDEIFGPILPIITVRNADEAIMFIRERDKPLALYAFTEDQTTRRKFVKWTSSGTLAFGVTVAQLASHTMPFGGVGESGMGKYHGEHSVMAFSHERPVVEKPLHPDTLMAMYPPVSEKRMGVLRKLM